MNITAEIITASVGVLLAVGSGCGFVWNKIEKRLADMDEKLRDCERREVSLNRRENKFLAAIELLWNRVEQSDPNARELRRAKEIMSDLKADITEAV